MRMKEDGGDGEKEKMKFSPVWLDSLEVTIAYGYYGYSFSLCVKRRRTRWREFFPSPSSSLCPSVRQVSP